MADESPTSFIQRIRQCKTKADERRLIADASAHLRTSLKETSKQVSASRFRNIVKLLYIHMLGYSTQWAQIECLNLIRLNHYADKRAGYLALSLLLDENADVLLLATNSMLMDLSDTRPHVQALALNVMGNISNETQARAAAPIIEKLLFHNKPNIRKKAALVASRIVRKLPDLAESFVPCVKKMIDIQGQDNGSVLTIIELMLEIIRADPSYTDNFTKFIPRFAQALKKLTRSSPDEYDVNNVRDPFLQAALLRAIRYLAPTDPTTHEKVGDVLATVATNTDRSRNVGNAVVLECVQTIISLGDRADHELRVMSINALGKFLSSPDNNLRYVALELFEMIVNVDPAAVQKYRGILLECLIDLDMSIRRSALKLLYSLVDESTIRVIVKELMDALEKLSDTDLRRDLTEKLCFVMEKYAPSRVWYVESMVKLLVIPGIAGVFPEPALFQMLAGIASNASLQLPAVQRFWIALNERHVSPILAIACVWTIGEFGEQLLADGISAAAIVSLLSLFLSKPTTTSALRQHITIALAKLAHKFTQYPDVVATIKSILVELQESSDTETQSRAIELLALFGLSPDVRRQIFQSMPAFQGTFGIGSSPSPALPVPSGLANGEQPVVDLLGLNISSAPSETASPPASTTTSAPPLDTASLLGSLLAPAPAPMVQIPTVDSIALSLNSINLGGPEGQTTVLLSNSDLYVTASYKKPSPGQPQFTLMTLSFRNLTPFPMTDFNIQAAPPKYLKFVVSPLSATVVQPQAEVTAMIKAANSAYGEKPMAMKLRISYVWGGSPKVVEEVCKNFPAGM